MNKNKKIWIWVELISWLVTIIPILIYNAVNFEMYAVVDGVKLTITALIALGFVGFSSLVKLKNKSGAFTLLGAIIILMLQEIFYLIGMNMLIISIILISQQAIFKPLSLKYKEAYYNDTGRKVTYTRSL